MENKFKIFVIVAISVLALAVGASTFLVLKALNNSNTEVEQAQESTPVSLMEVETGEAILTNIVSEGSVQHFAKIKVKIGVDASDTESFDELILKFQERAASIRNELISTIGEQTYTMLSDTKSGKEKLADEIITRLNKLLDTEMIKAVYYEEYFIQ